MRQAYKGVPFLNAVANVAWKGDNVVSFGSSFVKPTSFSSVKPTITASSVIAKVEAAFDATYNQWPTSLHYLAQADGSAKLVHSIQVQNEAVNSWYEVYVDAHTGDILSVTDFVAEAAVGIFTKMYFGIIFIQFPLVPRPPYN